MTVMDGDTVVLLTYRGSPWASAKLRKRADCWACSNTMPVGAVAYRPIDNCAERMRRLCVPCATRIAKEPRP